MSNIIIRDLYISLMYNANLNCRLTELVQKNIACRLMIDYIMVFLTDECFRNVLVFFEETLARPQSFSNLLHSADVLRNRNCILVQPCSQVVCMFVCSDWRIRVRRKKNELCR